MEFSEDVDSWRVSGLWKDECMLGSVEQGLPESRKSLGEAGAQRKNTHLVALSVSLSHENLSETQNGKRVNE